MTVQPAALRIIKDYTIPSLMPGDQVLGVSRKHAASCPKSRLSSPANPFRTVAPQFSQAQSTAHYTRTETQEKSTLAARHLRRSRNWKGHRWYKVRTLRVVPAGGARRGSSGSGHEARRASLQTSPAGVALARWGLGRVRATTHHSGRATEVAAATAAAAPRAAARSASCPGGGPGAGGYGLGGGSQYPGGGSVGAARGGLAVAAAAGGDLVLRTRAPAAPPLGRCRRAGLGRGARRQRSGAAASRAVSARLRSDWRLRRLPSRPRRPPPPPPGARRRRRGRAGPSRAGAGP